MGWRLNPKRSIARDRVSRRAITRGVNELYDNDRTEQQKQERINGDGTELTIGGVIFAIIVFAVVAALIMFSQ